MRSTIARIEKLEKESSLTPEQTRLLIADKLDPFKEDIKEDIKEIKLYLMKIIDSLYLGKNPNG
jgi:hypothetical protein